MAGKSMAAAALQLLFVAGCQRRQRIVWIRGDGRGTVGR